MSPLRVLLLVFSLVLPVPLSGAGPALAGRFAMKGSDSMDPLLRLWIAEFQKRHPAVAIEIESRGSATAPPALTTGEVPAGHMSREMKAEEMAAFRARRGYDPTRLVVAVDALAIYVHPSNPLKRILLDQVDAVYSRTRLAGWDRPLEAWGDLGLRGAWRARPIECFGRDENSGTRAFFEEHVLLKGRFRAGYQTRDQWGVLAAVAQAPGGIGYGPVNYASQDVRMLPVVPLGSGKGHLPSLENILGGTYPLTRRLNIYVDKAPGKPLAEPLKAFLDFVLGPDGQRLVGEYGAVPLLERMQAEERALLER